MAKIDPEQERQRLAEFYAGQLDGELEKVATQAYDLTDLAREVLRAELKKRGLTTDSMEESAMVAKIAVEPQPDAPSVPRPPEGNEPGFEGKFDPRKMVVIRKFRDLPEALLAKGSLDSAGINCALLDENVVRLDWFWSNLMGGVKLLVDPEDAVAADAILKQPIPEQFDVSGVGEYEQPHCPKCGSLDINFRESDPAAYVAMYVIAPIPLRRRAWRCHACHAEWEDDGTPDATESPA